MTLVGWSLVIDLLVLLVTVVVAGLDPRQVERQAVRDAARMLEEAAKAEARVRAAAAAARRAMFEEARRYFGK
jgi:putative exporter of polyketide antibiotics